MSCCAPGAEAAADQLGSASLEELRLASRQLGEGLFQTDLSIPEVHCAACIQTVEKALSGLDAVEQSRVNLSTKRVSVKWRGDQIPDLIGALQAKGYSAHIFEASDTKDKEMSRLIRALAVAAFSSMNIMLLAVSVWSGADPDTRQAFHLISFVLALPCMLYSGTIFYQSAWNALRHGRTNMDVPISIGLLLAFGISIYDTLNHGQHAYFDAVTTLIFFLLVGRTFDHLMREKAREAVRSLVRLSPRGAIVLREDGARDFIPVDEIMPGMRLLVAAGDRIPVDAIVADGSSDLDCAIVTGEAAPQPVSIGANVQAGTLNLTGPLVLTALAGAQDSFLAEMLRLMEAAEDGRASYRRLADRAAQLYSPLVHTAAFISFLGWMVANGDWHNAITIAIAVLIITCPCALGLAVPIVQVVAARRLFENGIMIKDGSGVERLTSIDTIIFDKTGTLTLGRPKLRDMSAIAPEIMAIASALGAKSNHPLSRALAAAYEGPASDLSFETVIEHPGLGIEALVGQDQYRLGRAEWALDDKDSIYSGTVLSRNGAYLAGFAFQDNLRPNAIETIRALQESGFQIEILSGDEERTVAATAASLGISTYQAGLLPGEKVGRVKELVASGRKVLMVGDGLNDAPALAAANVSMTPASAADIGRNAADFVFLRDGLEAVPITIDVARETGRLVWQNLALSVAYNAIALPIAVAGFVTPLIASVAMSASSIVVVANALRLRAGRVPVKAPVERTNPVHEPRQKLAEVK